MLAVLGGLGSLSTPGNSLAAQEFSAELAIIGDDDRPAQTNGKIYVSNDKVRLELPGFPDGHFLMDGRAHSASFVRPAQRVWMDAKQSSRLTQLLVPIDPDDPCKQWQAMGEAAEAIRQDEQWNCDRLGPEETDGRTAVKVLARSPQGIANLGWIDPRLRFLLKFKGEDGVAMHLWNVREGPQPSALFEMPTNFHKFDPRQLIERLKQSDVSMQPPD